MNAEDLQDLPDEVVAEIQRPAIQRQEQLAALSVNLAQLRDEAVLARKESGIESTWLECEEAYLGIDDENRNEFQGAKWIKPTVMEGPLRQRTNSSDEVRATAFVKLTSRYVDAGAAKVCEIALPIDGKPFTLKATPVPDMAGMKDDGTPAEQITGTPMPGPDGKPVTVAELAKHAIDQAEAAAEKAAKRVYDWMVEGKHNAEMRKLIFDKARIGVGVLKGPIPEERKATVVRRLKPVKLADGTVASKGGVSIERVTKIKPAARWVDPWCFFPAPGCGEDIHRGDHCFEAAPMLAGELAGLAKKTALHYIPEAIAKVLGEGPGKINVASGNQMTAPHRAQYQVWHFTGWISRAEFEAANPTQATDLDKTKDRVYVIATLVNDTVIRAIEQPLESGRLPYQVGVWRRRAGHWAGVGVGEQIRTPQRVVNAATRAMLNNAGKSSGAQVVMDPDAVEPANGDSRITPDKLWWLKKGAAASYDDVRKVFAKFDWPNTTEQLMKVVEYGFKLAEEHSSIPLITQGQSGKTTPDTFGGQQLQDNNAQQLLRDVGFGLNDTITTPLVDLYYEWLLLDPDVPDDEKGDYQVDTSGALALIEKALQDITILAIGSMVQNAAFRIDPAKWFAAYARAKRLSPAEFQYTDAEWEEIQKQPKPKPDAVAAAEIRAASAEKIAGSHDKLASERNAKDVDRDTRYNEVMQAREETIREATRSELATRERIAQLNFNTKLADFALQKQISLEDAKVALTKTTMELTTQKELATASHVHEAAQVAQAGTEPPGRAPDGQAFQK